ncbi:MAG: hypothetical protein KGZ81_10375 [Flavobacteriales bacterium]|nr:hypothetical protein [Flavobacteriales bacterium]
MDISENKFEMNIQASLSQAPSVLLILIWAYSGVEKLLRFEQSRKAFHNQTFPAELAEILSHLVPIAELLLALLLLFSITRWWGYLGSILLLTVFLTYVGLIWVGAFPRVPCNCAGIIENLGWGAHFILNMFLIGISVAGMRLEMGKKSES